jgi:cardiolipin-specific phospholipase
MTDIKQDTISTTLPAVIPPTSHMNFLKSWWKRSDKTSEIAEIRLLKRYMSSNVTARVGRVDIGGKNRLINTLVVEKASASDPNRGEIMQGSVPTHTDDKKALVMCHGYGAGKAHCIRHVLYRLDKYSIFCLL